MAERLFIFYWVPRMMKKLTEKLDANHPVHSREDMEKTVGGLINAHCHELGLILRADQ